MEIRDDEGPDPRWALAIITGLVVIGGTIDLILDRPASLTPHVLFELGLIFLGLVSSAYLFRGWRTARNSLRGARQTVAQRQAERDAWRMRAEQALSGLGEAVGRQFDDWGLSRAERETALMLLKGFSLKRIAALSGRSERTVRQHAVAVYGKSGLGGRAELSGFFLGDLLLPNPPPRA